MKNQKGFSLVQTLVACGVGAILMYALTTHMSNLQTSNQTVRLQMTRDHLVREMVLNLSHQPTIDKSALLPENKDLLTCRDGSTVPATKCRAKDGANRIDHELTLISSMGTAVLATGKGRPYNGSGSLCGGDDPASWETNTSCPLKLVTGFRASCPGDTAECAKAESIEFFYRILVSGGAEKGSPMADSSGVLPYSEIGSKTTVTGDTPINSGRMSCHIVPSTTSTPSSHPSSHLVPTTIPSYTECCFDMGTKVKCVALDTSDGSSTTTKVIPTAKWASNQWKGDGDYRMGCTGVPGQDCTEIGRKCGDAGSWQRGVVCNEVSP